MQGGMCRLYGLAGVSAWQVVLASILLWTMPYGTHGNLLTSRICCKNTFGEKVADYGEGVRVRSAARWERR